MAPRKKSKTSLASAQENSSSLPQAVSAQASPTAAQTSGKAPKRKGPAHWETDGIDGGPSSYELFIQWLRHGNNRDLLKNGLGGKKPKDGQQICADWLNTHGAPTPRDASGVKGLESPLQL
jgi:hypothetical protein